MKWFILFCTLSVSFTLSTANLTAQNNAWDPLTFNPGNFSEKTLTFPSGESVRYRAYEKILYVAKIADPVYQTVNIYVPQSAWDGIAPAVFLKTNVGGYMAAKVSAPSVEDATGRALQEGYVVVIPGSRGSNSTIRKSDGSTYYTGVAPAGIVDLKAVVRYLRHNASRIPGNMERIITDGTSAGGALSALLGASGNHPAYEPYLRELEAARAEDHVFASVCYCPITDLEHADMAYEWLFHRTNGKSRPLSPEQTVVSEELAEMYPVYLNRLGLRTPEGTPLAADNYTEYLKSFLIASAQRAHDRGMELKPETGVILTPDTDGSGMVVSDIDMDVYFTYIIAQRPLKNPPAFDAQGVIGNSPTPENKVFGDTNGTPANFTDYSRQKSSGHPLATVDNPLRERVTLMNPMNFIEGGASRTAPYWYIRHGAVDRDTAFTVPVNLYTRLQNQGYEVDFLLPWNRNHSGDYDLDELFAWIRKVLEEAR